MQGPRCPKTEVLACCRYFVLHQLARTPRAKDLGVSGLEAEMGESLYSDLAKSGFDMSDRAVLEQVQEARKRALEGANRGRGSKAWSNSVDNFLRNPSDALSDVVKAIKDKGVVIASLSGNRDRVQMMALDVDTTRRVNLPTMMHNNVVVSRSTRLLNSLSNPR